MSKLYLYILTVFVSFLVMFTTNAYGQFKMEWNRELDINTLYQMYVDSLENIYVAGVKQNFQNRKVIVKKYNSDGDQLWEKEIHSSDSALFEVVKLTFDKSGNLIVAGYRILNNFRKGYIFKMSSTGSLLWVTEIENYTIEDLAVSDDGVIYSIGGRSFLNISCHNTNGDLVWQQSFPDFNFRYKKNILIEPVTNNLYISAVKDGEFFGDYYISKFSSSGTQLWERIHTGQGHWDDVPKKIFFDESGNLVVFGETMRFNNFGAYMIDMTIIKYSPSGEEIFLKHFHGNSTVYVRPKYIVKTETGNYLVTGESSSVYLLMLDNNFEQIWIKNFGVSQYLASEASINNRDHILISGHGVNFSNITTFKFDNTFMLNWAFSIGFRIKYFLNSEKIFYSFWTSYNKIYLGGNTESLPKIVKLSDLTNVEPVQSNIIPSQFILHQNFPNPFNPVTKIKFEIPIATNLKIKLYNVHGKELITIAEGHYYKGQHSITLDLSGYEDLSSGVYFYSLISDADVLTKKLIFLK